MSPPQLVGNTGQYGEFVLVQNNPALEGEDSQMDDWSHDSVTWALTVHEARPGHEMQFTALVENGTSLARSTYAFLAPGQATSYYYGYRNLERLRTEVEMALGDRFNQRKYHDFLLKQGLLPPELLRQAVLQEFVPAQ